MKITFLLTDTRMLSGGQRVLAQIAAHLKARGHQVTLLSRPRVVRLRWGQRLKVLLGLMPRPPQPGPEEGSHFHTAGLDFTWTRPGKPIRPEDVPDGDLLIASWWECAEFMDAMPPEKGRQVHLIQDHENFPYLPQDRVEAVHRNPRRKVAVSGWLAREMKTHYGVEAALALNGIDAAWFDAPARARAQAPTVGFVYSASPRKNPELAVEALRRARAANPDLQAIVFGAVDPGAALPEWVRYERRPSQARIREIYAACDAWLFPSRSEGFGLPILEAMGCRTPVLATRAGAAPDLIEDGVNGRLLPDDPDAFAAAIAGIAAMAPEDWRAMSAAARATAEAHDLPRAMAGFEAALLSR